MLRRDIKTSQEFASEKQWKQSWLWQVFSEKPSKESQSKDYLKALELRMQPWQSGNLLESLTLPG